MIINFRNINFNLNDFNGSVVEGKVLYVYVGKHTFDLTFKTTAEAKEANDELAELLKSAGGKSSTETKKDSLNILFDRFKEKVEEKVSSVDTLATTLSFAVGSLASLAKNKAKDAALNKLQSTIEKRVESVINDLGSVLDGIVSTVKSEEAPVDNPKAKEPVKAADQKRHKVFTPDVFGAKASTESKPVNSKHVDVEVETPLFRDIAGTEDEPLIGDLTEEQLEQYIDEFMQDVLGNERVQDMFKSILGNFDADTAANALDGFKKVVLSIALQNEEKTLSSVLKDYFM